MQLGEYLKENGENSLNVVALAWTEGRYEYASEGRLQRMVEKFHPAIKVICETPKIVDAFSPLVYVPDNFVFDKGGKQLFGDDQQNYVDKDRLAKYWRARNNPKHRHSGSGKA